MRSTDAPLPRKRPFTPSLLVMIWRVGRMPEAWSLPVWNKILHRSNGATEDLAIAPAVPPAMSSCF
jgi:hypothetical protein